MTITINSMLTTPTLEISRDYKSKPKNKINK